MGKKQVVLVTGAGSGFGRETVFRMAKRGYHVIAAVETTAQIYEMKERSKKESLGITFVKLDISDPADRRLAEDWDVDILLNNGAVSEGGAVVDLPEYVLRKQFDVNVFGTVLLTQIIARKMIRRKAGKIVFISSVAGLTTDPFAGAYSASKHAIEAFAEALNKELKEFGIKVATINPGPIYTGFNDRMFEQPRSWPQECRENAVFDYSQIAFPHEQYDPAPVYDIIENILTGKVNDYRNVVPEELREETKKQMAEVWSRQQNDKTAIRDTLVQKAYDMQPEVKKA